MYQDKEITVRQGEEIFHYKGDAIIIATGAAENMVTFEGWTLPGVIGAGAAQTMMNLHGVKPEINSDAWKWKLLVVVVKFSIGTVWM